MSDRPRYEVVVVGGGPAGLTTALYATRLGHRTAAFDEQGGRHTAVRGVHNVYGVSEDVSGKQLSELAVRQLEEYGGDFHPDAVERIERDDDGRFRVEASHATVTAERVVLATGFSDEEPGVPELRRFTGRGLHYCLHCDAYALGDGPVFVLGHGEDAAEVAMLMLNFTDDVELLLNGADPEWSDETEDRLGAHPIERIDTDVVSAFPADDDAEDPWLGGLRFADRSDREYLGGFAMYGKEYNTALAEALGCELDDDGAVEVDENFETSVDGVYAVGDVTHGQNQTAVAVGDGARAGIALHKSLRTYPLSLEELDSAEDFPVPGAAGDVRARMRRVRGLDEHAGLRRPAPEEGRVERE
ncbi:NAD(P)/FAD-dependent oxidoreductase [Halopelagius fulvigenes]|uniref:NAD(P)/FAD-dependent oxidoreductase n=1 Tax=Halopelagius fulvigenes TaxID=1198324 RepID=A0ABD5U0G4_9EURY